MERKKITDYDYLRKHYTFLNDKDDDTWESHLVSSYHESLFKEYAICDLTSYKSGNVGLRWRTAEEVLAGKCEKYCSNSSCSEQVGLKNYELLFKYTEHNEQKQTLVKVRVCQNCSTKLKEGINKSTRLFIDCIKDQSFEDDLIKIEGKLLNELDYNPETFSINSQLMKMKDELFRLTKIFNELYLYKRELFIILQSQLNIASTLDNAERYLGSDVVTDGDLDKYKTIANHLLSLWNNDRSDTLSSTTTSTSINTTSEDNKPIFTPITDDLFDTVPVLVRRRVKLNQLNELYRYLFDQAMKINRCLPIKMREISDSGIQVFGQTGSSKIATLRYLKIISVASRECAIQLLDDRFKKRKRM